MSDYPPDVAAVLDRFMTKEPTRRKQVPKVVGKKPKPAPAITLYTGRKRPEASGEEARRDGNADRMHGLDALERKQELRKLANRLAWLDGNGKRDSKAYWDCLAKIDAIKAVR